jgi:broad specificity phosphatase PhoE
MLTAYYSPHMTSVDNEAGRASGHADVPLSMRGRELARELGQQYASIPLDAAFSSDLQRATITAEIAFTARGVPLLRDARLRECDFGSLTQCPPAQLDELRHLTEPYPGGESIQMVVERMGAFLREVACDYGGKTVVLIGHKATKYALAYWSGSDSLAEIVRGPWEWRDIPIWRYELTMDHLQPRSALS